MPLSYSQLRSYQSCPRQYEYAFIKKLKRPISSQESFGSSVHNTLKKWGELEMAYKKEDEQRRHDQLKLFIQETPHDKKEELNLEKLLALWHESFINHGYKTRIEADFNREVGEKVMMNFFDWWMRKDREVLAVEKGFKWELRESNNVISGRFDRVERNQSGLRIVDFKTGSVRKQEHVDLDLQLSIYALAAQHLWHEPVSELILLFLSEEEVVERKTLRNESQLTDAQTSMKHIIEHIHEGNFAPTPSNAVCRHCPFANVCDVAAV